MLFKVVLSFEYVYTHQLSRFRRESHACESKTFISCQIMPDSQKNVNVIHFYKIIVHVNHASHPGSPISKGESLGDCSSSIDPKRIVKLQNLGILRNVLGSFRKSSEIVGSSSETLILCRIKISRLWLSKSWQVYTWMKS